MYFRVITKGFYIIVFILSFGGLCRITFWVQFILHSWDCLLFSTSEVHQVCTWWKSSISAFAIVVRSATHNTWMFCDKTSLTKTGGRPDVSLRLEIAILRCHELYCLFWVFILRSSLLFGLKVFYQASYCDEFHSGIFRRIIPGNRLHCEVINSSELWEIPFLASWTCALGDEYCGQRDSCADYLSAGLCDPW